MAVYTTRREPGRPRSARRCRRARPARASSRELTEASLERIRERDGTHSHDGDPGSINAWCASTRTTRAPLPRRPTSGSRSATRRCSAACDRVEGSLCGRRKAADRVRAPCWPTCPERDCDVWARLRAEGMVLLGHLHTHEFACGGTTEPGREPVGARAFGGRLERRVERGARIAAGGGGDRDRHGGIAAHSLLRVRDVDDQADARARLAARGRPARADVRPRGPDDPRGARLRASPGGYGCCSPAGGTPAAATLGALTEDRRSPSGRRRGVSIARSAALPGERIDPPPPGVRLDVLAEYFDLVLVEWLVWHRRFEGRWASTATRTEPASRPPWNGR